MTSKIYYELSLSICLILVFHNLKLISLLILIAIISNRKSKEIFVEPSYTGVSIKLPIQKQNFYDLINSFKLHKVKEKKIKFKIVLLSKLIDVLI